MERIAINLCGLVFVQFEGDGALFIDGDGDEIKFYCSGNKHDRRMATKEILKATIDRRGSDKDLLSEED
jgi:hypothetical protein